MKKKKTKNCTLILCVHGLPSLHKPILVGNENVVPNCAEFFAIYFFLIIKHCSFKERKRNQEKMQEWCAYVMCA